METELKDKVAEQTKLQVPARAKTLRRLSFSKPKARFLEYKPFPEASVGFKPSVEEHIHQSPTDDDDVDEDESNNEFDDDDDSEVSGRKEHHKKKNKKKKLNWTLLTEWVLFFLIMACLICSLTIKSLKAKRTWGLKIWKWCLMVLVTFCGRLVSGWLIAFAVFIIERNFMLREKVLYFVYELRKSIQNCIWLGLVLLAYTLMFDAEVHKQYKMLKKVFQALVAVLLAAIIWLIKIVLVKMLASSFHVTTYFDRMKESVFHHYILDTLSGPPMDEQIILQEESRNKNNNFSDSKSLSSNWKQGKWKEARNVYKSKKYGSRKIDMEKLRELSLERPASAWSVKRLVSYVMSYGLSTISKTVDDFGKAESSEITSEWEARNTAQRIFRNVAKPGAK